MFLIQISPLVEVVEVLVLSLPEMEKTVGLEVVVPTLERLELLQLDREIVVDLGQFPMVQLELVEELGELVWVIPVNMGWLVV